MPDMQALTSCNLASFSLIDCVQTVLGRTLEVLPPPFLAGLAGLGPSQHLAGVASLYVWLTVLLGTFQPQTGPWSPCG